MSWEYCDIEDIEGVRKVKWDSLWHVLYRWGGRDTWDRVNKATAMRVLEKIKRSRNHGK